MADVIKKATRESYGEALRDLAGEYKDLVVLDADLAAATKTGVFKKACPERFFDCGIAEANMINSIQRKILSVSRNEEPFDIFISKGILPFDIRVAHA